jgi:peptidoglycan-N-acetylglucosamine deacetylase
MGDNPTQRVQVQAPAYRRARQREVWLTFDDGPHPQYTPQIFTVLAKHKINAVFFVIGENVKRWPKLVHEAATLGHRIGNHTFTHPHLPKLSAGEIRAEILKTEGLIGEYLGAKKVLRPPYGDHNSLVDQVAYDLGYRLLFWNVDTLDWDHRYQPDGWEQHGIDQIRNRNSSVVLNHDIHQSTAEFLDEFVLRIMRLGNVTFRSPEDL